MTKQHHNDNRNIALRGQLWMMVGDSNLGGHGRIELLEKIDEHGSITQAAKAMKMSYKAAWDTIDAISNLSSEPLLERRTGGKKGGGTQLTARGKQLIVNFRQIEREHHRFIEQLSQQAGNMMDDLLLLRRINMKTSARNQFVCRVIEVKKGAVNDEIILETTGGQAIVAVITRESSENLQLKTGAEAFVLIKASSVIVVTEDEGTKFSARNRLNGKISRLIIGPVNTEVVIEIDNGGTVAAVITNESRQALELTEGKNVSAIFKASSVILGV